MTGAATETHTYDGDGNRVKAVVNSTTSIYVGNYYEVTGGVVKKYYYAGNVRVAENNGGVLHFLLSDHLGSTAVTTSDTGARVAELRYYPFGDTRYNSGSDTPPLPQKTTFRFTGQRWDPGTSLYFYGARWYDPFVGRFLQADTIVPQPGNPQALNRYAYAANNPLRYTDPTGHFTDDAIQAYLKATYGANWEQYWKTWSGDQPWLDLLHAAQGGDILSRAMWSNGNLSLSHFVLAGSGHDVLSGVYKAENLTSAPELQDPERVPLHSVYLNQGEGMSVLHFAENGAVNVAGKMGDIRVSLRAVNRDDVRAQGIFQWLLIFTVGKLNPLIGASAGLSKALLGPEIGDLPGMKEGDTHLSMGLSVDLGSVTHMSFYETFFRKGSNLGRNGLFDGITTFDRPKTQIRPF